MKIAISAGHTPSNPGKKMGVLNEYILTSEIMGRIVNLLGKKGHEVWIVGADSNTNQVRKINELKVDCGLELHFNSYFDSGVSGTETLHAGSAEGEKLADCIQRHLIKNLDTKNRGTKIGYFQGDTNSRIIEMLRTTNCPFAVPEPLFLSSLEDLTKLDTELIAQAIANGLTDYDIMGRD